MAEAKHTPAPHGATGVLVLAPGETLWGRGFGAEGAAVGLAGCGKCPFKAAAAKADKAEADAQTAHFNAQKAQLELAAMGGQLVPVNQITPVFPA